MRSEIRSGNDYVAPTIDHNKAFNDFFYPHLKFMKSVGCFYSVSHQNNIGFIGLLAKESYNFYPKSSFFLNFDQIFASSKIDSDISPNWGFELDLLTSYSLNKFVLTQPAYLHLFAFDANQRQKNNYNPDTNNSARTMFNSVPVLYIQKPSNSFN